MHSWIRKSLYRQVVRLTGIPISLACCRHRPPFCLSNGRLNESGSGISRLICVASKLPEKARRDEPSPAQLHAFCSQDYDTEEIYAHIIWDVVQKEREIEIEIERWGMGCWETGRVDGDEDTAGWESLHVTLQQMPHFEVWQEMKLMKGWQRIIHVTCSFSVGCYKEPEKHRF